MSTAKEKYEALVKEIESKLKDGIVSEGTVATPVTYDEVTQALSDILGGAVLSPTKTGTKPKSSAEAYAMLSPVERAKFEKEQGKHNVTVAAMSPNTPFEHWAVHVYPDPSGVLHFQAKVAGSDYYARWFMMPSKEDFEQIAKLYESVESVCLRNSFYGSNKKYLICSFGDDKEIVSIPGFGEMPVTGMFSGTPLVMAEAEEEDEDVPF